MTINLETGLKCQYRQSDYITKISPVWLAKPGTPCPMWIGFLNTVLSGDQAVMEFLQRYMGYCMTGYTTEQVLVFLYGTGGNGKGVFTKTMLEIFGDYAVVAPIELLIASKGDRHPTEIAKLRGARLVVATETQEGRAWDEVKLKLFTGSDKLTGRFMRQDFFDFTPTHKFLISGNHMPSLRSVDEAIRRRLLVVPFSVHITNPDTELFEKMKPEWPAIMRWMVDGCTKWLGKWVNPDGTVAPAGLQVPDSVRVTSNKYFEAEDILTQWLEECTEADPNSVIRTTDLFLCWRGWCEIRMQRVGSEKAFTAAMDAKAEKRKFQRGQNRAHQSVYTGIKLRPNVPKFDAGHRHQSARDQDEMPWSEE